MSLSFLMQSLNENTDRKKETKTRHAFFWPMQDMKVEEA